MTVLEIGIVINIPNTEKSNFIANTKIITFEK
jgi:hypothetical protein